MSAAPQNSTVYEIEESPVLVSMVLRLIRFLLRFQKHKVDIFYNVDLGLANHHYAAIQ